MTGVRIRTDVERAVEAVATGIWCPQPCCEEHLGRVRAAGGLRLMPLVAAWDRGEIR